MIKKNNLGYFIVKLEKITRSNYDNNEKTETPTFRI